MALTGGAIVGQADQGSTVKAIYMDVIQLDLDNAYATGGYTAFATFVKSVVGTRKTPVAIFAGTNHNHGLQLIYNRATDALLAYWTGPALSGVFEEVTNGTDLSGCTNCELVVLSV